MLCELVAMRYTSADSVVGDLGVSSTSPKPELLNPNP